jgi:hypothetical protein
LLDEVNTSQQQQQKLLEQRVRKAENKIEESRLAQEKADAELRNEMLNEVNEQKERYRRKAKKARLAQEKADAELRNEMLNEINEQKERHRRKTKKARLAQEKAEADVKKLRRIDQRKDDNSNNDYYCYNNNNYNHINGTNDSLARMIRTQLMDMHTQLMDMGTQIRAARGVGPNAANVSQRW